MRILVLGGTRFIGRAIVQRLAAAGHTVCCVHRGQHGGRDLPATHLLTDRRSLDDHRDDVAAFAPEAVVDCSAMNGADADAAIAVLPPGTPTVVLSSVDVYRAFGSLHAGVQTDAVPLHEASALRAERFAAQGRFENIEVEQRYLEWGATALRLGAVYGEHDYQRRFEFILRRVRAGRPRIPIGSGTFLFSRVYVGDVADAVALALAANEGGRAFNIVESATWAIRLFAERILEAAGASAELVEVDERVLPDDLAITKTLPQDLLATAEAARSRLGWRDSDPFEALRRSVAWHLDHPPEDADPDFSADDAALRSPRSQEASEA